MTKIEQLLETWKQIALRCRDKAHEEASVGYKIDMNRMAAEYEARIEELEKALK